MASCVRKEAVYRLRQTPLEKELVRHFARMGSNLNQVARWVNVHKSRADALDVLVALAAFERELKNVMREPCT